MKAILRGAAAGAVIASLGFAASAQAATTDSADVQATVLTALAVKVDATNNVLDFGTLADGGIASAATIGINTSASVTCATNIICGGTPKVPTFNVTGLAGKLVGISFVNASETLNYQGTPPAGFTSTTLTAGSFVTDAASNQVTLTGGAASFKVAGQLTMQPDTAPGLYQGTVSVTVAYN